MSNDSVAETAAPQAPGQGLLDRLKSRVDKTLTDATRRNPLLYYRDNGTTRLSVPPADSPFVTKLLDKSLLRRPDFGVVRDEPSAADDMPRIGPAADSLMKRLRSIKAKSKELEEERGLRTLFVAVGMVSWPATDDGRAPLAPLFLVPVRLVDDPRVRGDLALVRSDEDEIVVNRALMALAPAELSARIHSLLEDGTADDPREIVRALRPLVADLPGVEVRDSCALGIFNFAYRAMIEDLQQAGAALEAHPVVRALAGDPAAQAALTAQRDGSVVDVDELDAIAPLDEPFVLDADPWQSRAIHTIVRDTSSHAIVDGPPGTGKSQTIANLIAALIANGRSVLFVAEKRAALDVVRRRLDEAGLGALILDLHGADVTRRRTYAGLKRSLAELSAAMPASDAYDGPLEERRTRLNAHRALMHTPLADCALSPYEILAGLARVPGPELRSRLRGPALAALTPALVRETRELLDEAALNDALFLRRAGVPWSRAALRPDGVTAAVDRIGVIPDAIASPLRAVLRSLGFEPATTGSFTHDADLLVAVGMACATFEPAILDLDDTVLGDASAALAGPFAAIVSFFSPARRRALRAIRAHQRNAASPRAQRLAALKIFRNLPAEWKTAARRVPDVVRPDDTNASAAPAALAEAAKLIGFALPDALDEAFETLRVHAADRTGAFRAARMREIEAALASRGLDGFVAELASSAVPPAGWADSFERMWLESHLESVRRDFAAFNGRLHDRAVDEFRELEGELRRVSAQRVRRLAAQRRADVARTYPKEDAIVRTQLEKVRPRKPFRDLFAEAPNALLGLAPCVMASPLSISQFLPRATIFDVVVFDEASQVTPEAAVTAILRGRRLVVAGDDKQLPPTDFFQTAVIEDDDADDEAPIEGVESVLNAVRPFAKPLGLRVHYRSRDEDLIAFSNHFLYGDELVTFAGSGLDDPGVRHELVAPSGADADEVSSAPEVRRVVELVLDHATRRPHESLGVIALGIEHARRIESALELARRDRPDLDGFFNEQSTEPFFVKNLERVQGDERDAIILTLGYGRTKTGGVSHNFGPINRDGGERRLNVAITRAKTRLTLVSSFRKADLDPNSLRKFGSRLLASYLGYCESAGRDLGRDVAHPETPLNAFELDIKSALEQRLGVAIVPQYGIGQYRIDLAIEHRDQPGRFVLAVECDGATYHDTPTARMRDRLRRQILQNLGWRFCRIWSTDWFNDRESELARVERAYDDALAAVAAPQPPSASPAEASAKTLADTPAEIVSPPTPQQLTRDGPSPARPPYASIDDVHDRLLIELIAWINSDRRIRTDVELLEELMQQLGFKRHGPRIVDRLTKAIARSRTA
jgi:very-short-patch-repair endonuclease